VAVAPAVTGDIGYSTFSAAGRPRKCFF